MLGPAWPRLAGSSSSARTGSSTSPAAPPPAEAPPPRLLGAFEPVLLGWTSREPLLGSRGDRVTVGGLFRAFALVRGRAAGTWTLRGGEGALGPFGRLGRADRAALEADAADVLRFLTG